MAASFDLLVEPWIDFVLANGQRDRRGIAWILEHAHEIVEIVDPSPLVRFSIYRLLLAIVHWVAPVKDDSDWWARWKGGRFAQGLGAEVRARGFDRFDLFHQQRPFYQDPRVAGNDDRPVSDLWPEIPADTAVNHFRHVYDDSLLLCPLCCAKGLALLPPFCTSGGAGKSPSINDAPPLYFLPRGETVFQTLMLSLPIPGCGAYWDSALSKEDVPSWEGRTGGDGPIGFLEGLTWQPRAVLLRAVHSETGECSFCGGRSTTMVKRMVFLNGRDRKSDRHRLWRDPHVGYVERKGAIQAARVGNPLGREDAGAGAWRTAVRGILLGNGVSVQQAARLRQKEGKSGSWRMPVECFAFATDKMKYVLSGGATWDMPLRLLTDDGRSACVTRILESADSAAYLVREQVGRKEILFGFESQIQVVFRGFLDRLAENGNDEVRLIGEWTDVLRRSAMEAYRTALPAQPSSRWYSGMHKFEFLLGKVLAKGGER